MSWSRKSRKSRGVIVSRTSSWPMSRRWIAMMRPSRWTTCPICFSGTVLAAQHVQHRVELPQDLLEPQLVGLVHDDEQVLVVGGLADLLADEMLGVEELVEA
jgi:hypothetical protein